MPPETEFTIVDKNAFSVVVSALNKLVSILRPTFGPKGNKVIIDKTIYRMVVDHGVQIARDFSLPDPAENAIIKIIRDTPIKTSDLVGDGTTCATLLLQGMVTEVSRKHRFDGRKIEMELNLALKEVKERLSKVTKQITTKEDLKKVAMTAFDDEHVAEIIADLYFKLGKDASITIDFSQTMETYSEYTDGIKLDVGYISPYMINNPQPMEAELKNPFILITDYRLTETADIFPIMEKIMLFKKENPTDKRYGLVLICENIEHHALATLIRNMPHLLNTETGKPMGPFPSVAINLPKVEDRRTLMEDLAILTGGEMYTQEKGNKLENATIEGLGSCEKFICRKDESLIIKPKGENVKIAMASTSLKELMETETDERKRFALNYRHALFANNMAIIKVGAPTDNDRKTQKYKVEDAVHSVKSAFNHGVVRGAGLALAEIKTSSLILNEALKYPHRQLMENMGLDESFQLGKDEAYNVVTKETGNFLDVGVVDPVEVLIAGLESAVSTASLLLTVSGMIIEHAKLSANK